MAFPYIFESNFEAGTNAEWDSETDTGSLLDFPHVTELARGYTAVGPSVAPFRGAYCARIRMGDTNDHALVEGDIDIATGVTRYFRWYMFLGNDIAATADDNFSIFELQQAGGTQVYVVGLQIEADDELLKVWVAEDDTPETVSTKTLPKGRWICVEVQANVDTAAANGDITVYIDGEEYVSLATPVQNAAGVGRGVLGTQATLATTTGTILFDQFAMDDARIYPIVDRYPVQMLLTKSGHLFVGPGIIENISLLSGNGTDCVLSLYDTNRGNTSDAFKAGVELKNVTANDIVDPAGMPVQVKRGAYVSLTGTTPRAIALIRWAPAYGSAGAVRAVASKLKSNPLEEL